MPTKPLDRLMFAQGSLCFFCRQPLPKAEASVEHLLASANGGSNNDENCVACCKSVNALLGSMSLKEKFQVVLNQKGQFKCPNGTGSIKAVAQPKLTPKAPAAAKSKEDQLALVVANLKQRGNSKPRTLKTLTSTIASLFPKGLSEAELTVLVQQLQSRGKVVVSEKTITYAL
ncbi:HNH endonuclease [Candidatus Nitrotoga sp. AM1P]|uniref:HNH endonuclease n=1 Tax=Candidatus Nitrotoga sp. AM1P TaxID=2559597 RepID=UPI001565C841|nr:HNH endonuclease [Candidatus Nitrotoga sp. AM1P]